MENLFYIAPICAVAALIFAFIFYKSMIKANQGTEKMIEIANHVKDGAMAYLTRQYKVVSLVFVILLLIFIVLAFLGVQNPFVPIANTLIERGHSIYWITGRHFKTKVENTGATFHPFPEQWDPGDKEPYEFFPELKEHTGLSQVRYYLRCHLRDLI